MRLQRTAYGHSELRGFQAEVFMDSGRNGINTHESATRDPHVQQVVKAAHEELRQLMRQRSDIMKRIGTVKQTIIGLANLFGDEMLDDELLELVDRKSSGRQPGFTKLVAWHSWKRTAPWAHVRCASRFSKKPHWCSPGIKIRWRRSPRCSIDWLIMARLARSSVKTDGAHGSG